MARLRKAAQTMSSGVWCKEMNVVMPFAPFLIFIIPYCLKLGVGFCEIPVSVEVTIYSIATSFVFMHASGTCEFVSFSYKTFFVQSAS